MDIVLGILGIVGFFVSLTALVISHSAHRASNRTWLKLLRIEGGACSSVKMPQHDLFRQFIVKVQNLGIPLHQAKVSLWFQSGNDGSFEFALKRVDFKDSVVATQTEAEFSQGMVGAYALRSFDLDEFAIKWLRKLDDPRKCNAQIRIYSQDYQVGAFPLWQRFYKLKGVWNRVAHVVNWKFNREVTASDGRKLLKLGKVVPTFNTERQFRLECFIRGVVQDFDDPPSLGEVA